MKICLYIPCRNGEVFLPEVLAAVAAQTHAPHMRLLVNDCSSDSTASLARENGWTVAETNPGRCGLSVARNVAVAAAAEAGCDVIAGIDADAVPCETYVEVLARIFDEQRGLAGVCGNMRERFSETPSDLWRAVHMRQHYGEQPILNPPILFGSSAAYRTEVLQTAGGFNESLRTNFEDSDMTQRLLRSNHKVAYEPMLRLEHLKRDTPDSVLRMFWNWYLPPAVLGNQFFSVESWLGTRLSWIWSDYRSRSRLDDTFPSLTLLTLALPWIQVSRDVQLLAVRLQTSVDVRPLSELAIRMLRERGFQHGVQKWVADRLEIAAGEQPASGTNDLNPAILTAIAAEASASIPRRSFWANAEHSARTLDINLA